MVFIITLVAWFAITSQMMDGQKDQSGMHWFCAALLAWIPAGAIQIALLFLAQVFGLSKWN